MLGKINHLKKEIESFQLLSFEDLETFRLTYISKNGKISQLFEEFKTLTSDQKRETGKHLNILKQYSTAIYDNFKSILEKSISTSKFIDVSLPSENIFIGSRHPISIMLNEITSIFSRLGFIVTKGPEIEDDWHVFSGLNFPEEHPARDMQDTFFIQTNPDILLRTHTSSVQVRVMENKKPPIREIFPGRVFRNEAISARSHCIFHQIEGLYIDTNVSFADLKQTLLIFAKELFGKDSTIRLRPSFFPFTEPSAELDVSCSICKGNGCNVCKYTGYVEILGCGMVDPNTLESSNIDSKKYTGFAFGMGIERPAMIKYQINDIRLFFENDIRFLSQFTSDI